VTLPSEEGAGWDGACCDAGRWEEVAKTPDGADAAHTPSLETADAAPSGVFETSRGLLFSLAGRAPVGGDERGQG